MDQKLETPAAFLEGDGQVAGLLGGPSAVGMGGDAGQEDLAALQLDEEQDRQPSQTDRLTVKKSQASTPEAWDLKNSTQVGPPRRGAGPRRWRRRTLRRDTDRWTPTLAHSPAMRT